MDIYHFFLIYSWMPFLIYLAYKFWHTRFLCYFPLPYVIRLISIIICFLQPLGGLSLAHTQICNVIHLTLFDFSFDFSVIYALYSLLGLSLAHICLLTGFL